jgi:hypothetical protein
VLDDLASNTYGFLSRDASVSSTQLNTPIGTRKFYHQHKIPKVQDVNVTRYNSIKQGLLC